MARRRAWRRELLLSGLWFWASLAGSSVAIRPVQSVPLCSGVTLSASYLAAAAPGQTAGFRFTLFNHTRQTIRLSQPVPSSSDWYARSNGRWLWRSSSGAGGSLLHAGEEHGRVVVYRHAATTSETEFLTIAPHTSVQWLGTQQENPVLAYNPSCRMCSYPGEHEYHVIFAYAYAADAGGPVGLLGCGLRSAPVPMPPRF